MKDSHLFELNYKEFSGYPTQNGFFSKTSGSHLFLALYEHFAISGKDASDIIEVDSQNFKCVFQIGDTMEKLPADEDSEEEDKEPAAPETLTEISASVQVVEENPDQPTIPKLVYMSFKRKGGNPVLFGQFMRTIR